MLLFIKIYLSRTIMVSDNVRFWDGEKSRFLVMTTQQIKMFDHLKNVFTDTVSSFHMDGWFLTWSGLSSLIWMLSLGSRLAC